MHTEYSDRYITMGLKIAYYRKKAGFTQEVLAEKIGKSSFLFLRKIIQFFQILKSFLALSAVTCAISSTATPCSSACISAVIYI